MLPNKIIRLGIEIDFSIFFFTIVSLGLHKRKNSES